MGPSSSEIRLRTATISDRKLYGRAAELRCLRESLKDLKDIKNVGGKSPKRARLILVSGGSGTGKSKLIERALETANSSLAYGMGKFEQHSEISQSNPTYTPALLRSITDLSYKTVSALAQREDDKEQTVETSKSEFSKRRQTSLLLERHLDEHLDPDLKQILVDVLPDFVPVTSSASSSSDSSQSGRGSTDSEPDRKDSAPSKGQMESLKYGIRSLISSFVERFCLKSQDDNTEENSSMIHQKISLGIWLDDIHWMDAWSLAVLSFLLNSPMLPGNFVFVGSYRTNELPSSTMDWVEKQRNENDNLLEISLSDLSICDLTEMLADLVGGNESDTSVRDLATLIHRRTNGNPLYSLQMLDMLQDEGLLDYSLARTEWTWDLNKVKERTVASQNVVDVLQQKMFKLPTYVQEVLKLCSLLGNQCEIEILSIVHTEIWKHSQSQRAFLDVVSPNEPTNLDSCLTLALEEGLLEQRGNGWIKFVHDRIQEAVLESFLVDKGKDDSTQWRLTIGKTLFRKFVGDDSVDKISFLNDHQLFLCTEQLNAARHLISDKDCLFKVAALNNRAAKRAAAAGAFVPSAEFLRVGISLISANHATCDWTASYDLALDLHSSLAEVSLSLGLLKECQAALTEVFEHATVVDDKIRAFFIQAQCLSAQGKLQEQVTFVLETLQELGEPVSPIPRSIRNRVLFLTCQKNLKAWVEKDINPAVTTDRRKACAVQIMFYMIPTLEAVKNFSLSKEFSCRAINSALENGLVLYAPLSFAMAPQLFSMRNGKEIDHCYRLAMWSIELDSRLRQVLHDNRFSAVTRMYATWVLHWREPLSKLVDVAIEGFHCAMHAGDLFVAGFNILAFGTSYFYSGLPLSKLAADLAKFCELLHEYGQFELVLANVPLFQAVLNLTGEDDNVLDMSKGAACNYRVKLNWNGRSGQETQWSYHMQVAVYCEEMELATSLMNSLVAASINTAKTHAFYHVRIFFFALISMYNARMKKGKALSDANRYHKMIRVWVNDHKAANLPHKLMILDAEKLTLDKKKSPSDFILMRAYDKAVQASYKAGFLQDAALACHLASHAVASPTTSDDYYTRAKDLYLSWGARAIVEHLDTSSGRDSTELLRLQSLKNQGSVSFRSRPRFRDSLKMVHQQLPGGGNNG